MLTHKLNENVQLQILEIGHAEALFKLVDNNRDYLREWLPWVDDSTDVAYTKDFIQMTTDSFANNSGIHLGIFYRGIIAGCIGLHQIDWFNKKTSIGYWLGAQFQGQGIMTSACTVLIDYIFEVLVLNRVEIRAAVLNAKSRAIPERLGMVQEGTIRQAEWLNERYVDHVVYGMLQSDWKIRNSISS